VNDLGLWLADRPSDGRGRPSGGGSWAVLLAIMLGTCK
jgi:hypothetical protein